MTNTPLPAGGDVRLYHDEGSSLGVLLGSLGFGEVETQEGEFGDPVLWADHGSFAEGVLRVITWPEDGHRVKVVHFAPSARPWVGPLEWEASFDGSVPLDALAGFLAVTLGKLAVR